MNYLQAASNVFYSHVTILFIARSYYVRFNRLEVHTGNFSLVSVENLRNLLKGGAASLDVEDAHKDEFKENPALRKLVKFIGGSEMERLTA
jgi:hypothetical protein